MVDGRESPTFLALAKPLKSLEAEILKFKSAFPIEARKRVL
jgi:hypothetical protein